MNPTPIRRRTLALVLAAAAPFALLACSSTGAEQADVESSADPGAQPTTTTGADGSAGDGDASGTTTPDSGGAPDPGGPTDGEVLGSSTGNQPADPNDDTLVPLQLDVRGIERMPGDIVEVRFSITNTGGDATYELWSTLSDPSSDSLYDVGGAALLDPPNDKRYLTLYDSDGTCLCTAEASQLAVGPGDKIDLYAQFPAPPDDVTEVTFTLPGFDPIDGLAIR